MVEYRLRENVPSEFLATLFREAWPDGSEPPPLDHSLTWVTAHEADRVVGFVNLAWDGGRHAFLLDTTVHPTVRGRGIGEALVRRAVDAARAEGIEWVHVDYEPPLASFYERCGFRPTLAGLIHLQASHNT